MFSQVKITSLAEGADNEYHSDVFSFQHPQTMQTFNAFMIGFTTVFSSVGEALVLSGRVLGQSKRVPQEHPARKKIDFFDGFRKDRQALASDWLAIGKDFQRGIDEYVQSHQR